MKILHMLQTAALATFLIASSVSAEKVASMPKPTGYVDDYANVLSPSAKTQLEDLCTEVHAKTKAQVFLVTIKSLEGEPVETFANELFHTWKIGEKKTDRGVLVFLAIQDHKRWIEVGYGFEGILNDAKVGDIGREMLPALKESNYDDAARIGVKDISKVIAADAGVTLAALDTPAEPLNAAPPPIPDGIGQTSQSHAGTWALALFPILFFGLLALFIIAIIVKAIRNGVRGGGGYSGGSGFGGGGYTGDSGSTFTSDTSSGSSDSFSGGDGGDSGGGGAGGDW